MSWLQVGVIFWTAKWSIFLQGQPWLWPMVVSTIMQSMLLQSERVTKIWTARCGELDSMTELKQMPQMKPEYQSYYSHWRLVTCVLLVHQFVCFFYLISMWNIIFESKHWKSFDKLSHLFLYTLVFFLFNKRHCVFAEHDDYISQVYAVVCFKLVMLKLKTHLSRKHNEANILWDDEIKSSWRAFPFLRHTSIYSLEYSPPIHLLYKMFSKFLLFCYWALQYSAKVLSHPSFLYILLPMSQTFKKWSWSSVPRDFWKSFKVLLWTLDGLSLIFIPVLVPAHFQRNVYFFNVKPLKGELRYF